MRVGRLLPPKWRLPTWEPVPFCDDTSQEALNYPYPQQSKLLLHFFIQNLPIYPKEMEIYALAKACTSMFIIALFTVVENWKQPNKCSLAVPG